MQTDCRFREIGPELYKPQLRIVRTVGAAEYKLNGIRGSAKLLLRLPGQATLTVRSAGAAAEIGDLRRNNNFCVPIILPKRSIFGRADSG